MPRTVKIADVIELTSSREAVWPLLSRTDWINRAIGLPPVTYDIQPLPEGGSNVSARAKVFGAQLSWTEHPFEWTEPKFHRVRRTFHSGPIAEGLLGVRLNETAAGCAVEIHADFTTKNAFGDFVVRNIIGPKTARDMRALVKGVGDALTRQQRVVMPKLPTAAVDERALNAGLRRLREDDQPLDLVSRFGTWLVETPDVELSRIRPFAVARNWNADRWAVLGLFLHATRAGLLNLSWEILCPNCRSTRMPRTVSLKQLSRMAHCEVCNIKFDAEFDKSVELKFSVHPSIRPCDEQTFCLAGPGGKPHIVSQIVVAPGQQREWDVPELTSDLRLRSVQVREATTLQSADTAITCRPECFELSVSPARSASPIVSVSNPNTYPVTLALERNTWDEDILTASRATNWQEFRDLFAAEVVSPIEQITVGAQVVVFTDLRGSTAMYSRIGDTPAYALVRDHFKILHDVVNAHHGTIVKTIGDAVMAVFTSLNDGLAAVRQMHEQLARAELNNGAELELKSGFRTGPCLAVNANDRLDFFGSTVNFAARLVESGEGNDLVVADDIYWRMETQQLLRELLHKGSPGEENFTGFSNAVKIWRIPIL